MANGERFQGVGVHFQRKSHLNIYVLKYIYMYVCICSAINETGAQEAENCVLDFLSLFEAAGAPKVTAHNM